MAQRGGVVSSHVRFGQTVYSPLIPAGKCDVMLAFEQAEALRWAHTMTSSGTIIVNTRKLVPPIALMKGVEYPENPLETVQKRLESVIAVDAQGIAAELGNSRVENTILLGVLSNFIKISPQIWKDVIRSRVPKGTEELNLSAFQKGAEAAAREQ